VDEEAGDIAQEQFNRLDIVSERAFSLACLEGGGLRLVVDFVVRGRCVFHSFGRGTRIFDKVRSSKACLSCYLLFSIDIISSQCSLFLSSTVVSLPLH